MTREQLIAEARSLEEPPSSAMEEFAQKRDRLAAAMNERFSRREDLLQLIGDGNQAMMEDNHRNHVRFMHSLFQRYLPEVLVDTVLWVFRAYRAHGFQLTYWPAQLDTWIELFRSELTPESFHAIEPYYHWMLIRQPAFAALSDQALSDAASDLQLPHGDAAHE
ncbi:MAG: hypothetical protein KFH87_13360 [Bacteroidetes bacterium]|nr:hypothetical protein [Bacteroidota bacterium]